MDMVIPTTNDLPLTAYTIDIAAVDNFVNKYNIK